MIPRNFFRWLLVLYLVFPFLFLLMQFRLDQWPDWKEFFWAFKNSFLQAFFSAFLSVALGTWTAFGLLCFSDGRRRHYRLILELFCLLPNFLPPLFILLSVLNFVDPFPMGLLGITLVHTIINFGLVAVLLTGLIENKMASIAELALIEGASRRQFLQFAFWPLMKRDLWMLFLFVFAVCFGSFAIPLIVGGGRGTTLEVLIYEKIRLSTNWSQAVILALFQSIFIFAVSSLAMKGRSHSSDRPANLKILRMYSGIVFLGIITALCFLGYLQGLVEGLHQLSSFYEVRAEIFLNFFGSLAMGTLVGLCAYGSLLWIAYCWPKPWFEKFFTGYVAPSTSLCCFAFLVGAPNESFWPFIKIPLAFNLLVLTSLYRMGWDGYLHSLENQITVARTLGARAPMIFKEILLPQISKRASLFAAVAAVWACGDFAVSRIIAHQDLTLAMMTETLMSGYRLGMATVLSVLVAVAGVLCFFICLGVGRVFSRKPLS